MHTPPTERLLRKRDVERATGLHRATINRYIRRGIFPRPVKIGRLSAWPESEVQSWIEDRKAARA